MNKNILPNKILKDGNTDSDFDSVTLEIERKWILESEPEGFSVIKEGMIEQLYLVVDGPYEIRIRKMELVDDSPECYIDIKSDGDLTKTEISIAIEEK